MPYNIFCVIPAYNEAETISQVIKQVKPMVHKIIVIDDGSVDNTASQAKESGAIVGRHLINRGQGAALETGNQLALILGADIIIHFDADGQFLASEIPDLVKPIENGESDVALGSRFLEKASRLPFLKKYLIFPLAGLFNQIFFKLHFTDPQSGFRVLSRRAAELIHIEQDRMAHCNEILIKIKNHDLRVKEVPITVIYHDFGQKFSGSFKIIEDLVIAKLLK
jgi:polyprenyl-phospho-N-acetylgalactosaminyl synthase